MTIHARIEEKLRAALGASLPILNLPVGMPWAVVEMFVRGLAPRS